LCNGKLKEVGEVTKETDPNCELIAKFREGIEAGKASETEANDVDAYVGVGVDVATGTR
jgi:hypothetical protein